MRVALAQINPVVGDLDFNIKKIIDATRECVKGGVSLLVTPELGLTGYPPEDLMLREEFLVEVEHKLEILATVVGKEAPNLTIVIGHPCFKAQENLLYNSASVFKGCKFIGRYSKLELPNYAVFDERRYFASDGGPLVFKCDQISFGVNICEDIWFPRAPSLTKAAGADVLIVLNASPFQTNKDNERKQKVRKHVSSLNLPVLFCNVVGGQDELVFDGSSFALDRNGDMSACAPEFQESLLIVDLDEFGNPKKNDSFRKKTQRTEQIFDALVLGTRDYGLKNDYDKALVGLSGGIDSAVTLGIAAHAFGRDSVKAVFMRTKYTSAASIFDAKECAKSVGVNFVEEDIDIYVDLFKTRLSKEVTSKVVGLTEENIQSRIRGLILMAISNNEQRLLLTTGNKSELAVGYCTLYGDMCGGFAVLKDVYKTQVYKLATYLNSVVAGSIPRSIIEKCPSAELRHDQKDEDTLPDYETLDGILYRIIDKNETFDQIVGSGFERNLVEDVFKLMRKAEFKRRQAPPGVKVSEHAFGRDWRYPISNKFVF